MDCGYDKSNKTKIDVKCKPVKFEKFLLGGEVMDISHVFL